MSGIVLIVGIVLVVIPIIALIFNEGEHKWLFAVAALGLVVMLFSQMFTIIPTGYTGVRTSMGIIDETPISSGFAWKRPFLDSIKHVDTKMRKTELHAENTLISAESKDKAQVFINDVSVTYKLVPGSVAWFASNVTDYENNVVALDIITSAVKGVLKGVDTYDATTRTIVEPMVKEALQDALNAKYGEEKVEVYEVLLVNMSLEDRYKEAVEQKNIAEQTRLEAETVNQTNLEKAQAEAEIALTRAQASADAAKIEAEGIAEANRIIAESMNSNILQWEYIKAIGNWNPQVIGEGSYPTFSVNAPVAAE